MSSQNSLTEVAFHGITTEVMRHYNLLLHEFLESAPQGSLTEPDVVVLIMNITMAAATNMYFSIKQYLPNTGADFDFLKAKMINSFVDAFEGIKTYDPKSQLLSLSIEQVQEIIDKGFVMITMPDGQMKKVTREEVMIKKDVLDTIKKEPEHPKIITNTTKIVTN